MTCVSDGSMHDDALPLNVNHEGWNDVIQLSAGLSWIVSRRFLGLLGQTVMAYWKLLNDTRIFCIMFKLLLISKPSGNAMPGRAMKGHVCDDVLL